MTQSQAPIGVIGGGTMGVGIAYVFAAAGHAVTLVEPGANRRHALRGELRQAAAAAVKRGKMSESEQDGLLGRITLIEHADALPTGLALAVETVPEQLELKLAVLAAVEARGPALLVTNTSAISIERLSSALNAPERFMGMHFFNPVWSLALVELVRGGRTSAATIAACESLVAGIGKQSIVVRDIPGFATSRLDMSAALEAMRMLEDGVASAEDIDRAATLAYRHPVGPLRLSDIVGLDVRLDIARTMAASHGARFEPPQILVDKVAAGDLGRKTGRGFHTWAEN